MSSADKTLETGLSFTPRFSAEGLIPAIATDHVTGAVLMFAHMNAEALARTLTTGLVHFWSRSRGKIWLKGEESGNLLRLKELRTDCDQDVIWVSVDVEGNGVACHTGAQSCFYRRAVTQPTQAVTNSSDPSAVLAQTALEFAALPKL